jgi:Host cell surface-exposed lipoprotein
MTGTLPPQPPQFKKPAGLAIAALVVGIVAFLFGLVPVFGALVGIAAVVLGILALRKHQSKGMAITGTVLGGLALVTSIATTAGIGAALNSASVTKPAAVVAESAAPAVDDEPAASEPTETTEPAEEAEEPEPEAPAVPAEYASALIKAESYSGMMNMSKAGLYDQLTSEYGEKFSAEAAQYAIDNVQADWSANALAKAKTYQEQMAMAPAAIRDQLVSEYGEKFTPEEADYAILHLND